MDPDRKATLEAALEASNEGLSIEDAVTKITTPDNTEVVQTEAADVVKDVQKEPQSDVATHESTTDTELQPKNEVATEDQTLVEKPINTDRPPQAWKAANKAKWATVDPEIRQEVLRREHETTRVLNETAEVRQFATQFHQAVQPYLARIQQIGHPIKAVANLLAADHLLATGPRAQKAQYLAKLIVDYGVDIKELDAALAGAASPNQEYNEVERLVAERMAPVNQFIQQQQHREQLQAQQAQQQVAQVIQQMSSDPKYPYFDQVRETMADLIELKAQKGQTIDLQTAYNMAVAMDPGLSQQVQTTTVRTAQTQQAAAANARAQRALNASSSVSGSPTGSIAGAPKTTDRRAHLEAAFANLEGR